MKALRAWWARRTLRVRITLTVGVVALVMVLWYVCHRRKVRRERKFNKLAEVPSPKAQDPEKQPVPASAGPDALKAATGRVEGVFVHTPGGRVEMLVDTRRGQQRFDLVEPREPEPR